MYQALYAPSMITGYVMSLRFHFYLSYSPALAVFLQSHLSTYYSPPFQLFCYFVLD
ncbi:hypothetical protein AG1IA_05369 [Rhizoctonia solani AG-1 IA]|uniref:Uncharacterized protein n=1 Tax=Thanatephorus cucumeris (strain AG1-IA) TaxID=983506 RepID=L8WRG8_THACA|nr:hypothetical protein AG1IA_05369 [Rhizoctonia solani AG-1 IA]